MLASRSLYFTHMTDIPQLCNLWFVSALPLRSSITIVKCDLPEPSVEFLQNPPGFKTTISDLSIAITGGWRTHFGLM